MKDNQNGNGLLMTGLNCIDHALQEHLMLLDQLARSMTRLVGPTWPAVDVMPVLACLARDEENTVPYLHPGCGVIGRKST